MKNTAYRYPNEHLTLFLTLLFILVVIFVSAWATLCLVPLLILVAIAFANWQNNSHHQMMLSRAVQVNSKRTPALAVLVDECQRKLHPGDIRVFIVSAKHANAYTYGLSDPKGIVLFSPLLEIMDEDELKFVIGHEMGHAALGHTWINTLVGGMGGVPLPFGAAVLFTLIFRWWNRACEHSADRAGLLVCANPEKAISALVKLVAGDVDTAAELKHALQAIDKEDDSVVNVLLGSLSTHPMIIKRVRQIQKYARSSEYKRLLAQINK